MPTLMRWACVLVALFASTNAFVPAPRLGVPSRATTTRATSLITMNKTPLVFNGKRKEFAPGSNLLKACNALGMKVPTSCKKGDCGTCTVSVAGKLQKSCVGKVPPAPKLKSLIEKGLVCSR